jgi:hypothetical protein
LQVVAVVVMKIAVVAVELADTGLILESQAEVLLLNQHCLSF